MLQSMTDLVHHFKQLPPTLTMNQDGIEVVAKHVFCHREDNDRAEMVSLLAGHDDTVILQIEKKLLES